MKYHLVDLPDEEVTFAPSRGRELKFVLDAAATTHHQVRPLAGAGIEIDADNPSNPEFFVRPLAGAGIEIEISNQFGAYT